jgi:hypothetical protein
VCRKHGPISQGPRKLIQKLLDTINSFNNLLGYKSNLQKSVDILYINSEQNEKEYKKTIPFTMVSIKYLRIDLTKDINDFYKYNYKPLKKEINMH